MEKEKLESITIMKAENLPASVREENKLSSGFIELRVIRKSPPTTEIRAIKESPLKTMRKAFEKEGILGKLKF